MNESARQSVVLIIEEDSHDNSQCSPLVKALGATCYRVSSLEDAESVLKLNTPDVVIVDYSLPDGSGIDLIGLIRQNPEHRNTPIILLTGEIHPNELERAVMMGIYAFLARPFSPEEFSKLVSAAITEESHRVRNDE
ncbi:MAG: response regulator [Planctomycetes bacterium]|nr:response regulator [Planctomycetota bacterium]